jgi:signal transduction histidine kinase
LAISRDLARAMNGDLTVEEAPGGGAAFTVTLPKT